LKKGELIKIILHICVVLVLFLFASDDFKQTIDVGANVLMPDASAMLEVRATNKGPLMPQVA